MPSPQSEVGGFPNTPLDDDERLSVHMAITEESTVAVPATADIDAAITALTAPKCRRVRAELSRYKPAQIVVSGGQDAVTYKAFLERWGVRNALRLLLGFSAEPSIWSGRGGSAIATASACCDEPVSRLSVRSRRWPVFIG